MICSMEERVFNTLPDLLSPGLDLVFVGINPGSYSAAKGHYYAQTGQPVLVGVGGVGDS